MCREPTQLEIWLFRLGTVLLGCLLYGVVAAQSVPIACSAYQRDLTRVAQARFGPDAPVAVLAAQIQQESACNPKAMSKVGAQGLTQFMPGTAKWIGELVPELKDVRPLDPMWAIKAQSEYMYRLVRDVQPMGDIGPLSECSRWAFALRGYNGGPGHLKKDRIAVWRIGVDPNAWRAVGLVNGAGRGPGPFKENTTYPVRILLALMPNYIKAGWGRGVDCLALSPVMEMKLSRRPAPRPILILRRTALA